MKMFSWSTERYLIVTNIDKQESANWTKNTCLKANYGGILMKNENIVLLDFVLSPYIGIKLLSCPNPNLQYLK